MFSLSSDYDASDKATQMFFAETQNKLLYAVTHQTAAEIIVSRADPSQPNMALTSWKGDIVRKGDITVAKNYLQKEEIEVLERLTVLFLDSAELRVKNRKDLTLDYWRKNVDSLLEFQDNDVLKGKGKISNKQMEKIVGERYSVFNDNRKHYEALHADQYDLDELNRHIKELGKTNDSQYKA